MVSPRSDLHGIRGSAAMGDQYSATSGSCSQRVMAALSSSAAAANAGRTPGTSWAPVARERPRDAPDLDAGAVESGAEAEVHRLGCREDVEWLPIEAHSLLDSPHDALRHRVRHGHPQVHLPAAVEYRSLVSRAKT
jgi:hypothetical protein